MISWWRGLPQPAQTLSLVVAAVLTTAMTLSSVGLLHWWWSNVEQIAQIESRYERVAGYIGVEGRLETSLRGLTEQVGELALPSSLDGSQAGAQLQQALRNIAELSGLTVSGSQLLPPKPLGDDGDADVAVFERLAVQLSLTGPAESISQFLSGVYAHRPLLTIDNLSVNARRLSARQQQRLARSGQLPPEDALLVSCTVSGLRVLP